MSLLSRTGAGLGFRASVLAGCLLGVLLLSADRANAVASISVSSTPSGAAVWLDNVDTGQVTPATLNNVVPGSHYITVIQFGYEWREDGVTAVDGLLVGTGGSLTPFWTDAYDLGGGWRWNDWLESFYDYGNGWLFHPQHQFLLYFGPDESNVWFWDSTIGWMWSNWVTYPYFYSTTDGAWLWYQRGSASPRWFYNFTLGSWQSH